MLSGEKSTKFTQISWVVPNLKKAIDIWTNTMHIGPFFVVDQVELHHLRYRGRPADLTWNVALSHSGAVQVELIEQADLRPSPYRDVFGAGEGGMHHVSAVVEDLDAQIAAYREQGFIQVLGGDTTGVRFAMFDTRAAIGCMTEFVEDLPVVRQTNDFVATAAAGWDGRDPIRRF